MKKLLYVLLAGATLASCDKNEAPKKKVLNPFAQITVHIKESLPTSRAGNDQRLTPREMLEQAEFFRLFDQEMIARGATKPGARHIGENEKDFDKVAFRWWGDDVVRADTIVTYWRDVRDLIIIRGNGDTIGYIPQHVRTEAYKRILEAEKEQDYDLIYRIFEEAFTGMPCTPEEYKELKEKGLN